MRVRIRTLDQRSHELDIESDVLVSVVKEKIKNVTQVSETRQRLIYRGRVLADNEPLSAYNVEDGHTIHMVARPMNAVINTSNENTTNEEGVAAAAPTPAGATPRQTNQSTTNTPQGLQQQRNRLLAGALDLDTARIVSDALGLSGGGASGANFVRAAAAGAGANPAQRTVRSTTVSGRANQQHRGAESLEHLRQGLLTLHTLLATMEEPARSASESRARLRRNTQSTEMTSQIAVAQHEEEAEEEKSANNAHRGLSNSIPSSTTLNPGRSPPILYAGQWIDVEDTVRQWLEATVMRVEQEPIHRVLVHYNGWPTRWDEWLNADSIRIAPFRTHTLHSHQAPHSNPTPNASVENAPPTDFFISTEENTHQEQSNENVQQRHHHRSARARRGREARLAVCEMWRAVQRISPLLDALSEMAHTELNGPENEDLRPEMPWRLPETTPRRSSSSSSRSGRRAVREELRVLARDAAPLVDRLGRVMTDLAPHLAALARPRHSASSDDDLSGSRATTPTPGPPEVQAEPPATADESHQDEDEEEVEAVPPPAPTVTPAAATTATPSGGEDDEEDDEEPPALEPLDEAATPAEANEDEPPPLAAAGSDSQTSQRPRHTHRARRRRHRSATGETDSYRQLIATPTRAPHLYSPSTPGNIDIHIHAILTPLRGAAAAAPSAALAPAQNTATATAGVTPAETSPPAQPPETPVPATDSSQHEEITSTTFTADENDVTANNHTSVPPSHLPVPAEEVEHEVVDLAATDEVSTPVTTPAEAPLNNSDTNDSWTSGFSNFFQDLTSGWRSAA